MHWGVRRVLESDSSRRGLACVGADPDRTTANSPQLYAIERTDVEYPSGDEPMRQDISEMEESAPGHRWRRGMFGTNPAPLRSDASISQRHWTSRLLHHVGAATAHSGSGATAAILLAAWVVVGALTGFKHWWELVLYSSTSGVT